jgi:hypothetical protein
MPPAVSSSTRHTDLELLACGLAAGAFAGLVMNLFARAVGAATEGHEAAGAAPGGDRQGRGAQPPQARERASEDAAVRAGAVAYRAVSGDEPPKAIRPWLGSAAHYGFSAAAGAAFTLLAPRVPAVRAGFGTLYGTLVWLLADEGVVPALGWSRKPTELSAAVHLYSLAGHWVYGGALALATRPVTDAAR